MGASVGVRVTTPDGATVGGVLGLYDGLADGFATGAAVESVSL